MKVFNLFTVLLLAMSFSGFARIAQVSENALDDDLNFKLNQDEQEIREVASEKSSEEKEEVSEDESQRDVASENENQESQIKYWKY